MPPPINRISRSSWTISGLSKVPDIAFTLVGYSRFTMFNAGPRSTATDQLFGFAGAIAAHHVLGEHTGDVQIGDLGQRLAAVGINRAFGGGADGKLEALHGAVAELDGPHDGIGSTQRLHGAAER